MLIELEAFDGRTTRGLVPEVIGPADRRQMLACEHHIARIDMC
jgi:hypothetical protein